MAADDPSRGSNRRDIKSRDTHVDAFGDALSDGGSIPPASTLLSSRSRWSSALTFGVRGHNGGHGRGFLSPADAPENAPDLGAGVRVKARNPGLAPSSEPLRDPYR